MEQPPRRKVGRLDAVAGVLVRLVPRSLRPVVEQARLDARSLVDGARGVREPSFSTPSRGLVTPVPLAEIDPLGVWIPRPLVAPYEAWRRDLARVGGAPPARPASRPPERRPRHAPPSDTSPAMGARRMRVSALARPTEDALTLTLTPLEGETPAFAAGQFLTLCVEVDGARLKRAYSLSSAPEDGVAEITCKRIPGGRVSNHLHAHAKVGDVFEVLGPSGSFVVPGDRAPRHVVLLAGGSGITPCWSIARSVLARDPGTHVTLVHANRAERDEIFAADIAAACAREGGRLRVVRVLEAPALPHEGPTGRLDAALCAALADAGTFSLPSPASLYFVCGPAPMREAVRAALLAHGVPEGEVLEERFQSPADTDRAAADVAWPTSPVTLQVRRRGGLERVQVPPGRTLLEAATSAGVGLPFSCAMGGCAACKCRSIEGQVMMDEPHCLSDAERADGWVLTCIARPLSAVTLEVP